MDIFVWKFLIQTNPKDSKVDKKDVEVYSPFVMVTGMILSSDNFSNVTIDNGKVISDGDKEMVVGVAVPGLKDSLDLSDDLSDKIDIPGKLCPWKLMLQTVLWEILSPWQLQICSAV